MVPADFIVLDALPLTSNGKLDRTALLAIDEANRTISNNVAPPPNPLHAQLLEIWQGVLGSRAIGLNDNFFDVGGHSLLATQVVSRIRQSLQAEVPLRTMFEAPTIEGLAITVLQKQAEAINEDDVFSTLAEMESLSEEEIECQLMKGVK